LAIRIIWELLTYGEYTDYKVMLVDLYCNRLWGMEQIGEFLGIDKAVVRGELVRLKIPIRPKGRPKFRIKMSTMVDYSCATFATMSITRRAIKK